MKDKNANRKKIAWVIGARNSNTDRSIPWTTSNFPNFSDPDILIIDLTSITPHILPKVKSSEDKLENVAKDKLMSGGTVIFITGKKIREHSETQFPLSPIFSNYFLSPIPVGVIDVQEGYQIRYNKEKNPLAKYLEKVKRFNIILRFQESNSPLKVLEDYGVTDNNNNHLGKAFSTKDPFRPGTLIFLPPPTETSIEEAIDIILQCYGLINKQVTLPKWVLKLNLKPIEQLESQISMLANDARNLQLTINKKEAQKKKALNWYNLLVGRDNDLDTVVRDSFRLLGINLTRKRPRNLEDGIFKFSSVPEYIYGILEIKGSNSRTSLQDMTQCDKWVQDYSIKNLGKGKGIFVTNQHRLHLYPESRNERIRFEPNELEYARDRKICVIPSCTIFDAVKQVLNHGKRPNRRNLEFLISSSNGVIQKLF